MDYAYDANGNLTSLLRHDQAGQVRNDFTYAYYAGTNKLRNLRGNTKDHYRYDAIGNLVAHKDKTQLTWTPYGKVEQVNATDENATTTYRYDAAGNRVAKQTVVGDTTLSTYYARDAAGNVLAIYQGGGDCSWTLTARLQYSPTKQRKQGTPSLDEPTTFTVPGSLPLTQGAAGKGRAVLFYTDTTGTEQSLIYRGEKATQLSEFTFRKSSSGTLSAGQTFVATSLRLRIQSADSVGADTTEVKLKLQGICNLQLTEQAIYGSSRLGAYQGGSTPGQQRLGLRRYELSNHLGNVLAVVSDNIHLTADSAWATVISTQDYYPFGLTMRERRYRTRQYRYAFNGKEQDKDFGSVSGTIYDYGFRVYDPKIAKFLSVDPLTMSYPWYTPYQFAGNKPIWAVDLDGLEELVSTIPKRPYQPVLDAPDAGTAVNNALTNAIIFLPNVGANAWNGLAGMVNYTYDINTGAQENTSGAEAAYQFGNQLQADYTNLASDPQSYLFNTFTNLENYEGAAELLLAKKLYNGKLPKLTAARPRPELSTLQSQFNDLAENQLLPKYRSLDPNLKAGYTGSFKTGKVGNPNKVTYGKSIDLDNFDIDYWIESDVLYQKFGNNLRADVEFRKILSESSGFEGLKPNKQGFSIKFRPSSNPDK